MPHLSIFAPLIFALQKEVNFDLVRSWPQG